MTGPGRSPRSGRGPRSRTPGVAALAVLAAWPVAAAAQVPPSGPSGTAAPVYQPSLFARDHDTPVAERTFRGLEAVGVPVGPFRLFPTLGVGLFGESNVFEDNKRRVSDGVLRFSPDLLLDYDSSKTTFDIYARGTLDQHYSRTSENENQATVGVDARRNLPGYSYVFANASYGVLALTRISPESPRNAASPVRYEEGQADIGGVYEQDRLRLTGRVDALVLSYDDGRAIGGGVLPTADRDRTRITGTVQAAYALSPATALYVGGSGDTFNYRLDPPRVAVSRDSHGYEVFAGTTFEVTGLTRADVRVGYLDQAFDNRALGDISGLGVRGRLEYFPSRLTTVTLEARRSVEDSGVPNTNGYLETGGSVAVDHEYRRYIMLNARASYFDDKYSGISRHDGVVFASFGATYLSRHNWNLRGAYEYYHQNSDGTDGGVNYDDHRLLSTLTFKY